VGRSGDGVKGDKHLRVWQTGMLLAEQVYALSSLMRREERYRITAQMPRPAASVPAT